MKQLMLLIGMVCATTGTMAERPVAHPSALVVADVTTAGHVVTPRSTACESSQSFSPIKATGFSEIILYDKAMSFPPDRRQDWQSGADSAFACVEREEGMAWQAPGMQGLEAMRLLPSYPNSNNPSLLTSGWRRFDAE